MSSAAPGWLPVIYVPAPPVGGIETGRAVPLPAVATEAEAMAAALSAMQTRPEAFACTVRRVAAD